MNSQAPHSWIGGLAAAAWLAAAAPTMAQAVLLDDLLNCQKITEAAARLACFDREVPRLNLAPGSNLAGSATPAAGPAPAPTPDRFGLRKPADDTTPTSLVTALPDGFSGWRPGERIRLANGQVWRIADDSSAFVRLTSSRVVVRQGALGAFYLEFDGDRRSPRVRRVE